MNLDKYFKDGVRYHLISSDDDNVVDIIALYFDWALRNNKKCIFYRHNQNINELEFFLEQCGHNFNSLVESRRLVIDSAYDYFVDKKVYINTDLLVNTIKSALDEGFSGIAIVADRECFFESEYAEDLLYSYEKKLDDIFKTYPISALSIYNIDKFGVDGFFAITHLNPNFIYKVINEIFVHNKEIVSFSYEETLGIVYTFLKRREKSVRENKIFGFISNLSTEISYKRDEREIIETTLKYICNTNYASFGLVDLFPDFEQVSDVIAYNVPEEMIEIYYSQQIKKRIEKYFNKVKYILINTQDVEESHREILNKYNIFTYAVLPIKYNEFNFGYLWLASRDVNNALNENAEFLYKVCETVAKMILQFKNYKKIQDGMLLASKLQALGELTGGVAHEFNNILTPILGYVQVLKDKIDDKELIKYLDMIEESAKDGAKIVKRIQEFSSKKNKSIEYVDIDKAIIHSVEITKPKWAYEAQVEDKKIDVLLNLKSGAFVEGIVTEVREVFVNLISNAVDAMPNGGRIDINSYNEDKYVVIKVKDNGIGMSKEILSRIFEPFFTTKNERGNGLGLHIVYNIITSMDGTIEVESKENYGSEFTIKLPIKEITVKEKTNTLSFNNSKNIKILIIDDQVHVANAVHEMLSLLGHDCLIITDNGEIDHVLKSKSFDAVICDLAMPGITGVEIAKKIKEKYPKTFFILMTGWLGKLKEEDLIYVDEIMQKPFSIEELRKAIEKIQAVQ